MSRNTYASIAKFGASNRPPCSGIVDDPLTYCMTSTMDVKFQHGPTGELYGPRSQKCQLYMAERCANKWDGFCEYFYRENSDANVWPYQQAWPNTQQPLAWQNDFGLNPNLTTGEQLLQNAARLRFCEYPNCQKKSEPFDPMNPDSVQVSYYDTLNGCGQKCVPVCNKVNPATLDSDPVMKRMLENPRACASTLINICNSTKNQNINIGGTQLGQFCNAYHANMAKLQQK